MEKVLEIGYTTMQMYLTLLYRTLRNGWDGKFHVMHFLTQWKIIFKNSRVGITNPDTCYKAREWLPPEWDQNLECRGPSEVLDWRNLQYDTNEIIAKMPT